jgi:N-acetyl-anhydromuramyl-L-alanine amidase AmpD
MIDFLALKPQEMWKMVDLNHQGALEKLTHLWEKVGKGPITNTEAHECLDALYIHSMWRIKEHKGTLASLYPTTKYSRNRFEKKTALWWVDHYTAGINVWGTLNWFSSMQVHGAASTHFIVDYHGFPFYIIPIMHGAWHCPARNSDSVSVEMVNAGRIEQNAAGKWCYWPKKYTQEIPVGLVQELPPVPLDKPWRGAHYMQPFTPDQLINNIKLKRLVIAADPTRFSPLRMSQHSDWQIGKSDMGPLWPFADVNSAAFDAIDISENSFLRDIEDAHLDKKWAGSIPEIEEQHSPEYGTDAIKDADVAAAALMSIPDIQDALLKLGYALTVDGVYGPRTHQAVVTFQNHWNIQHDREEEKLLKVDGIAGPQTQAAIRETRKN